MNGRSHGLVLGVLASVAVGCVGHVRDDGRDVVIVADARRDAASEIAPLDAPTADVTSDIAREDTFVAPIDTPPPPPDTPVEQPVDAGPCTASTIASAITTTTLSISARFAAPTPAGGAVVYDGSTVLRVDGAGQTVGAPLAIGASEPYGIAAMADRLAVLYARDSDVLALGIFDLAGTRITETVLLGAVPHDVTNNEWFGPLIRKGRVISTGTEWGVYFSVQRLWPDGIAHYGDSLRTVHADGSPGQTVWGWGCSHSMDVRLAVSGANGLGPLCVSDCYPGKGVYFDHNTFVYDDPSGNCAGIVDTQLGGVAAVNGGFLAAFRTPAARTATDAAIVRIAADHSVGAITWLTNGNGGASSVDVAAYGDGALVAWSAGGQGFVQRVDATGALTGAPESVDPALLSNATDFFTYANGDAGWAVGSQLVRVRACR